MNCQDFESNMDGLARGVLLDASARAEAEAHAESCASCAAQLEGEHSLSAGLRALALNMKEADAPARVETALLASFRARAASAAVGANLCGVDASQRVVSLSEHSTAKRWSWINTLAVASLAAAAALALFMLIPPGATVPASRKTNEVARARPAEQNRGAATQDKRQTSTPGDERIATANAGVQPSSTQTARGADKNSRTPAVAAPRASGRVQTMNVALGTNAVRGGSQAQRGSVEDTQEVATDFIPLMLGGRFTQSEGGHVVRVELPRSALASFGLPVNAERAGGRVKADVLLGDDGMARAIRFVR
jgi:hypothetical protein